MSPFLSYLYLFILGLYEPWHVFKFLLHCDWAMNIFQIFSCHVGVRNAYFVESQKIIRNTLFELVKINNVKTVNRSVFRLKLYHLILYTYLMFLYSFDNKIPCSIWHQMWLTRNLHLSRVSSRTLWRLATSRSFLNVVNLKQCFVCINSGETSTGHRVQLRFESEIFSHH